MYKKNISYLFVFETIVILTLFFTKLVFFNTYIKIGNFSLIIALTTIALVMAGYFIIMKFTKFNPVTYLLCIYILGCILMFIDTIYFAYLGKLPSFVALKMAGQLGAVTDTIITLISSLHIMFVIDLPLLIIYFVNYRKRMAYNCRYKISQNIFDCKKERIKNFQKKYSKSIGIIILTCFVAVTMTLTTSNFKLEYLSNELYSYHILDLYNTLKNENNSKKAVNTDKYVQTLSQTSPYYGLAKNRNVINIQVESMQEFVLNQVYEGQEITPYLNKLLNNDTINFDNYYYQIGGGNTSDAEFTINNSLYSPDSESSYIKYEQNDFYGLPLILKDNGYKTANVFHGYKPEFWNREKAYVKQGFDDYISGNRLNQIDTFNFGISDREFFKQSIEKLKEMPQPFYSFMITLSSHHPYVIPLQYQELELKSHHVGTLFGGYLQSMRYVDTVLGEFIEGLKANGLYDNSIITIYGDHFGLPNYDANSRNFMTELLGHEYNENDIFKVPMIMHIPGIGYSETKNLTGGHVDYLPTILHLLGVENEKGIMFGQNLLTAENGIVFEQTHMARGSFITDDIVFVYPTNGILINAKAFNKHTGKPIDPAPYLDMAKVALKTMEDCISILDSNKVIKMEPEKQP